MGGGTDGTYSLHRSMCVCVLKTSLDPKIFGIIYMASVGLVMLVVSVFIGSSSFDT